MVKFLFSLLFLGVFSFPVAAQFGFPYCETFQTNQTQANTIFGGNAQLTEGVLRLTNNLNDQIGYLYIDIPFPSAYGIKVEFEYFSYGGTGQSLADGLSVFLFDASTANFSPGGFGGSLGYAQRGTGAAAQAGLSNGYIGVGFDEFGNFGNRAEGKVGGFNGVGNQLVPDAVVVRGPGQGLMGYPFVAGRKTMDTGPDGLSPGKEFTISSGGAGTQRVTDPNQVGYRKVFLELQPNQNGDGYHLELSMLVTTSPNQPRLESILDIPYDFEAPKELKIGFAASTGGFTNFHEIRNMIVDVSAGDALQEPMGVDFSDVASCEGQENQYYILDEEVVLPNVDSQIRCLQFFRSLEDIESNSSDLCNQGRCLEENQELELPQGIIRAGEGGAYTFFPNPGTRDQQVEVFYTITDNYGKSSSGNKITLTIQESPAPVRILVDGNPVSERVFLCPDEITRLESDGEEDYERYEWYRNGELLEGENAYDLELIAPGEYEVWAYNRKNCPAKSTRIIAELPVYPELLVNGQVVGCEIGGVANVFDFLQSVDLDRFDYRLSGNGMVLLNEELESVPLAGIFDLRAKPKEFECFGDPVELEVFIREELLEVEFDFFVEGTTIQDEASGGIFVGDPLAFKNESDVRAVGWIWDFGDGTQSEEQNPIHSFAQKGDYEVELTVIDSRGCQNSQIKTVSVTRSYRIMVPTGFTPLGDENQFFSPKYKGLQEVNLMVFSNWGELLFQSRDKAGQGWDGRVGGKLADAGFYVYKFEGITEEGEAVVRSGKFKLIR